MNLPYKKTKWFTSMLAFVLAIVAAFSSKALNRYTIYTGYTKETASGLCHKKPDGIACTQFPMLSPCKTSNNVRTVYTSITCVNKLWKSISQ